MSEENKLLTPEEQEELDRIRSIEESEKQEKIDRMVYQQQVENEHLIDHLLENPLVEDETTFEMRTVLDELCKLEGKTDDVSKKREEVLMKRYCELSKKKWA